VRARDGFLAVAVFLVLLLAGFGLAAVGAKALGIGGGSGLVAVLIGGGTAGAVGTAVLARARAGLSAAGLGLVRPRRSMWHLSWQVPSAIVGSAVFAAVVGGGLLGLAPSGDGVADGLAGPGVPLVLALAGMAVACLLVPVVEEVAFRRYLLDGLRGRFDGLGARGTVLAVAVSTGVFAAAHVAPAAMMYVAPLGACMAWMRIWYASVWPGIVLHMVNNSLITAAVFAAAG